MSNREKKSNKTNSLRQDITLMTLLANESTSDSRKLLKKYGMPDAENHKDLEVKLAELYFATPDKIQIEKELASIHPHKDWIVKYFPENTKLVKLEPEEENIPKTENTSQADASCACGCGGGSSNFDATTAPTINTQKSLTAIDYVAILGVIGIIGLSFYVISKQK